MHTKGGGEKYKIGDVSKMLGLTSEAIRYYESQGVIQPTKDSRSGYRYYDVWDIHMLIRARSYRQLGYSLSETVKMLNEYDTHTLIENFSEQEKLIEQNIFLNINLLKHLRESQIVLNNTHTQLDTYHICSRPALYRLETQNAYSIYTNTSTWDNLQSWVSKVPFIYPSALFAYEDLAHAQEAKTFTFGFVTDVAYGDFLGIKDTHTIQYFPEVTAISTTIRTNSNEILTTDRLLPTLHYMKEQGLSLDGDVLSRVILMRKEEDLYVSYHQLWFPFKTYTSQQ